MALKEKLEKLKKLSEQNKETDWTTYREEWRNSITKLQILITDKWFADYEENGLMSFSLTPVSRIEPFIGEYLTTILEITLRNNKSLVFEPVSGVTAEYDGKLEFYMRGNLYNKAIILRKIIDKEKDEWLIATSYDAGEPYGLDKQSLEKFIDEWLQ